VNTNLSVGGVPGIDTQRMQSEVLVPDGGTTVMGGVLAEQDSTARQRTPGAASIPILGNLFKRKAITKNSLEILFFITPKIYRPDYFGRPTNVAPTQGPRTTSVPQPVPLGNPQSNTPTPTELQQGDRPQQNRPLNPAEPGSQNPAPPSNTARPNANQRP
jgi:type II secretory pathway component GspD/PulD (secretin)